MYDAKLIEAIDRIIAKTPEKLSKNAELIDVLMRCKAALTAPQEMTAREYEKAINTVILSHDLPTLIAWQTACDYKNWEEAVEIIENWTKEHSEEGSEK